MNYKNFFKDLKIIELASILAGPLVGRFFAELGANVIKIENKNANGDATRKWKLPTEDKNTNVSSYYASANYKKKSILLNLKENADYETFQNHLQDADLVISNFNPAKAQRLNVDYEKLKQTNSKIIYAQLLGYQNEPNRNAFDAVLQAETGYISMNGNAEMNGVKMPVAMIDYLAAEQMKQAILIALLNKEKTGNGSFIEVSLYKAAIAGLINQASNYLNENYIPKPKGSLHPNIAPYGETFKSKDEKQILLAIGSDTQFKKFATAFKIELDFKKYGENINRVKNRSTLQKQIAEKLNQLNANEIDGILKANKIPGAIVKNLKEVFENEEAQSMLVQEKYEDISLKSVSNIAFKMS